RVTIRRTQNGVDRGGAPRFGPPKTARSIRTISLLPDTLAALRSHRARQNIERLACGPDYATYDLIFATQIGTAMHRSEAWRHLHSATKRAGLPASLRPHDLRHTAATLMLEAGINARVVSDRLGHGSVALTLGIYGHVTPPMESDAMDRFARVMDGAQ